MTSSARRCYILTTCRRRRFSDFIAEGDRPWNDTLVFFNSSCLLLLSVTPPESCRSSLLCCRPPPIVSSTFLCFLCHPVDLQKCVYRGSVLCCDHVVEACSFRFLILGTNSLSAPLSFNTDSLRPPDDSLDGLLPVLC